MGKIDDVVGYLADFPSDLFSRSQMQLDSFARVALKDAEYRRIRLEGGSFLREQTGTSEGRNNDSEKKWVAFHDRVVLPHQAPSGE